MSNNKLKGSLVSFGIYLVMIIAVYVFIRSIAIPELIYQMEKSPITALVYAAFIVAVLLKAVMVMAVRYTSSLLEDYEFPIARCMLPGFMDYELAYIYSQAFLEEEFEGFGAYIDGDSSIIEKTIDFGYAMKDWVSTKKGFMPLVTNLVMWLFSIASYFYLKIKVGFYDLWQPHQVVMFIIFILFMINLISRSIINSKIIKESEMPSVSAFWATMPVIIPISTGILYFVVGVFFNIGANTLYNFLILISIVIIPLSMLVYSRAVFKDKVYEDQEDIRSFEI